MLSDLRCRPADPTHDDDEAVVMNGAPEMDLRPGGVMRDWMKSVALAGWLLAAVLAGGVAWAQVATTTVQDTVTDASGAAASGSVVISWGAFTTAAGSSVAAGSLTTTLDVGGALNVALQPNAGATPMGSYYTAVFHLSDGTVSREFWVVPVSGTAKLAGIRNQVLPTSVAMQTVSKQYVDTTVAKAMAGTPPSGSLPYLLKAGDTMQGPLQLASTLGLGVAIPQTPYSTEVYGSSSAGVLLQASSGDDSPGLSFHGTGRYLSVDASGDHVRLISESLPGVGPYVLLDCDGSGTSAGACMSSGPVVAPSLQLGGPLSGADTYPLGSVASATDSAEMFAFARSGVTGPQTLRVGVNQANSYASLQSAHDGVAYDQLWLNPQGGAVVFGPASASVSAAGVFHEVLTTPASSGAGCSAGDFVDDANFHYVCVAANTWKRVALSSF